MNKVLCGFIVLNMFLATQSYASGCDSAVHHELGKKLTEVSVTGTAFCYDPWSYSDFYHCDFSHDAPGIPQLTQYYVEVGSMPNMNTPFQATIEVYEALLYNDCSGPNRGSPPNAYYYKTVLNGFEYFNHRYK